jgi:DNA-binding transcriptional MerR regulator
MPIRIKGQTYYRTIEICDEVGISRATLYRWLKTGLLENSYRDRRGWRLFTEADLSRLHAKAVEINIEHISAREKK